MFVSDITALQKWRRVPKNRQQQFLHNVFCPECYMTTIINYSLKDDDFGILLVGQCKTCGQDIAKHIDSE